MERSHPAIQIRGMRSAAGKLAMRAASGHATAEARRTRSLAVKQPSKVVLPHFRC